MSARGRKSRGRLVGRTPGSEAGPLAGFCGTLLNKIGASRADQGVRPTRPTGPTAGQSMVEATLVLLVFFALLLGVVDCGQVLFAHEALVERARSAVRWGVVHPWQGPDPIVNLVLYGQTEQPVRKPGYLGMTEANVQVRYQPPTADHPDDEILTVSIVNFESHFLSPWAAKVLISPRPVMIAAPMAVRTTAESR
jgi:hypothetical protein